MAKEPMMTKEMSMSEGHGGHLYMQTNEIRNAIIHYSRSADGTITELERIPTGGAGSGVFKPISGQDSAPNAFEGAGSVILTPDRRFLFTTNGGDNSVSSFRVGMDGRLTLIDVKPTGNPVEGKSGTAKSLAYAPSCGVLFVLHSFGPDHLRLMSVDAEGKLTPRPERYTVNTHDKPNRVSTMVVVSPDEKLVFVGTTFDEPIVSTGVYPDGSPILWVQRGGAASRWPRRLSPARGRLPRHSQVLRRRRRLSVLHRLPARSAGYLRHRICRWRRMRHRHGRERRQGHHWPTREDRHERRPAVRAVLAGRISRRSDHLRHELRLQQHQQLSHQRRRPGNRVRSSVPSGSGRRHRQGALRRRHQRPGRQLDHAGWRVSLPDLRQCRETGGLRHAAERVAQRDHQREDSLQQPAGPGGILISLNGPSDLIRELSPSGSPEGHAGSVSDKELQRAGGTGRIVLSGSETGTRVMDIFQRAPLRIMFPRTAGAAVEEAVLINTAGGIAGGDRLQFEVTARPNAC